MSMTKPEGLPIPPEVLSSATQAEMARIWIADGNQVVTLSSRLWDDPGAWGLMLVDLAKHVATAYSERGLNFEDALRSIRAAMDAEWSNPTE